MAYTLEQIEALTRLEITRQDVTKPTFEGGKFNNTVYAGFRTSFESTDLSQSALKERYEALSKIPVEFALGIGEMPEIYNGTAQSQKYVQGRIRLLNDLIGLLENAESPDAQHRINCFLEMSKKAGQGAFHYKEVMAAVKEATKNSSDDRKLIEDYDKTFIYNPNIRASVIDELKRRQEHLLKVDKEGYTSDAQEGRLNELVERTADNGVKSLFQIMNLTFLYRMFANVGHTKDVLWNPKNFSDIGNLALGQNKAGIGAKSLASLSLGLRKGLSGALKCLGVCGPWGRVFMMGGLAVVGGCKLISDYKKEDSLVRNVGSAIINGIYGDAKNGFAAIAQWIIPGFESIISPVLGLDMFESSREENLKRLENEGIAEA